MYVNEIFLRLTLEIFFLKYAVHVHNFDNTDHVQNELINFNITNQLFFETLLMEVRGKTMSHSTFEKKQETVEEHTLTTEIESLENLTVLIFIQFNVRKR